jgi:hypothetical protein
MRQVKDKAEFDRVLLDARTCEYVDSRRAPTPLQLLVFDDVALCSDHFLRALEDLMDWSADADAYFVVLRPDPIDNFYRLYKKYPVLEIARNDSTEAYLGGLNKDVGDDSVFSLSNLCMTWVIVPPSNKWFIHAIRSDQDDSGHLWVPPGWVHKLVAAHPGVFFRDAPASLSERGKGTPGPEVV